MEASVLKHFLVIGAKALIVALAFLFILTKCGGCDNKIKFADNHVNDSLNKLINLSAIKVKQLESYLTLEKAKSDSLTAVKGKVEIRYAKSSKSVREDIKEGFCDTSKVLIALNDCDSLVKENNSLLSTKDSIINIQDRIIGEQASMVDASRTIINNQRDEIIENEKIAKKALRRQKFKTIGVITVAAIGQVLTILALK